MRVKYHSFWTSERNSGRSLKISKAWKTPNLIKTNSTAESSNPIKQKTFSEKLLLINY
jgi:hypothetical protein